MSNVRRPISTAPVCSIASASWAAARSASSSTDSETVCPGAPSTKPSRDTVMPASSCVMPYDLTRAWTHRTSQKCSSPAAMSRSSTIPSPRRRTSARSTRGSRRLHSRVRTMSVNRPPGSDLRAAAGRPRPGPRPRPWRTPSCSQTAGAGRAGMRMPGSAPSTPASPGALAVSSVAVLVVGRGVLAEVPHVALVVVRRTSRRWPRPASRPGAGPHHVRRPPRPRRSSWSGG